MASKAKIIVSAGDFRYPIIFERHGQNLAKIIGSRDRVVLISNPKIYRIHGRTFIKEFLPNNIKKIEKVLIGDGERFKNRHTVEFIYERLFDRKIDRSDIIIAFGGGVVGDTAGFAAATYMRGVDFVQVPTTLLAMVDASIGGKVGINHRRGKNLIGVFYQPKAVIIDHRWLKTLGHREMVEGLAEVIKVGFLSSEKFLKAAVKTAPEYSAGSARNLSRLIREAAQFKADIVAGDVHDRSIRPILNFGHTFAHSVEKVERYRRYRHGEAVMAGMVAALYLSHTTGHLSRGRLNDYLDDLTPWMQYLKPLKRPVGDYLSPMYVDKKKRNGLLHFILLEKSGRVVIRPVQSEKKVREAVSFMKRFVNDRGRK